MASTTSVSELYKLVQEENWIKVGQRAAKETATEADYQDPLTKLTPLHLAVLCRKTTNPPARLQAIRALLVAAPEAATVGTQDKGLTPLHYACQVVDEKSMEDDSAIVKLILENNPKARTKVSRDGHTALEEHIIAVSRVRRQEFGAFRAPLRTSHKKDKSSSTAILKALLQEQPIGILAKPLEVLFECNSLAILEQVALEEAQASSSKLRARRQARSSGTSIESAVSAGSNNFAGFWVWEWALIILKSDFDKRTAHLTPPPPFSAVHAASQVKDCPLPFLILCMRAYPGQVRVPDPPSGNLPLHMVAGWDVSEPASVSRKSMALSSLVTEYPEATKARNKYGKTPMSLALETGTSWDNGVRRLTSLKREGSMHGSMRSLGGSRD